jgi:hypothetical protein
MRFTLLAFLATLGAGLLEAAGVTLTPGSLFLAQPNLSDLTFSSANTVSYTKSGSSLGSGSITGLADLAEGVTVINGALYVSDGAGKVNQINLSTGAVSTSFSTGMVGLDALGSLNGNVLAMSFSSKAVDVYSTGGTLLQAVTLASLPSSYSWDGLASDGTVFYLADSASGRIYRYSMSGAQLGFLSTGAGNLLGLSYDASNNSLWFIDLLNNRVIDFSTSGLELSEFSISGFRASGGVAVVPGAVGVPEPRSMTLAALSLLLLKVCYRARC